jgi:uncharacterized protein (TIGR02217 family)
MQVVSHAPKAKFLQASPALSRLAKDLFKERNLMNDFHDVSFPLSLAFGASGGPVRRTDITKLASGNEHRNTSRAHSRRRYNAGAGVKSLDDLHVLIEFFEARFGQLHSFRFRDPMDHKSCKPSAAPLRTDQIIGTGDGIETAFQLIKSYTDSAGHYDRPITKPTAQSVLIAANGAVIDPSEYSVDELAGVVAFVTPPAANAIITAGYEFDVPVRFDTGQLDLAIEAFGAGEITNIPLIEVLPNA